MKFSLMFFSQIYDEHEASPYAFLAEMARYGDAHGFEALWIPERHFHTMGGIYPNPAVLAAALAPQTERIRLRAGSVVLPLHHPAAVVESWAVVDNLSGGRVDVAFASGWNVNDFVLAPDIYADFRRTWLERITQVRRLWNGEPCSFPNGEGKETPIVVYPRPVQPTLNIWLTVSKQAESFRKAGEMGLNVLTMLAGSSLEQLAEKVHIYRCARRDAGHDPDQGLVTLMLHSYLHRDSATVHEVVRGPFLEYVKTSLRSHLQGGAVQLGHEPTEREIDKLAEYSFERYFHTAALFGTLDTGMRMVEAVRESGVGEIACLLDFGPKVDEIRQGLPYLAELAASCRPAEIGGREGS